MAALSRRPWPWIGAGLGLVVLGAVALRPKPTVQPLPKPPPSQQRAEEAVSALGRLVPAGDVRKLAAPVSALGGSPRLSQLLVQEGDGVQQGQLLGTFDSRPGLLADQALLVTRRANLTAQLQLLERDTGRYRRLARSGATPSGDLDNREMKLIELRGQLVQVQAQLVKLRTDLVQSELRSPITGTVLRVLARPGERPGTDGILELGATDQMQAVSEVYESDIGRVRLGQRVTLISENGGFAGTLQGQVIRISPQVRQRQVLSTDPTGDADARVVEVRLALDPASVAQVKRLAGLKVIARFQP